MIQKYCEALGESGCYFLSILHLAESITGKTIDPVRAYVDCVANGLMEYDCFVRHPDVILRKYTGKKYEVVNSPRDYKTATGEFEILRFERKTASASFAHFVVGDGNGVVAFDPYGASMTVRDGYVASKRIFREA